MRYYCESFCIMSSEFADPTNIYATSGNVNIGALSQVLILLTLSQTTDFGPFQAEKVCRQQFQI